MYTDLFLELSAFDTNTKPVNAFVLGNQSRTPKVCLMFVKNFFAHVSVTQFNTSLTCISKGLCPNLGIERTFLHNEP